jgi:hypothetical protein
MKKHNSIYFLLTALAVIAAFVADQFLPGAGGPTVLAMASPAITSNYAGDVLDYIVTESVVGNEAVDKGSVYVIEDVPYKIAVGKMVSSANPIIAREAMPTTKSATVTKTEFQLQPAEMMIYIDDINPRSFEADWRPFQPKGALPNRVLDPNIQKVFADVVLKQAKKQMGKLMWQGDTTLASTSPLVFFNGYVTRAAASSTNIDVPNLGAISAANIIAILESFLTYIPDALFDDPDFVIHMSTASYRLYEAADRALVTKGSPTYGAAQMRYGTKEIRHYSQFPANKMLGCISTSGQDSCLYAATDKVKDQDNFIIEKLRPEGEHYFLKALFKFDANFSLDAESVYYAGS